MEFCTSSSYSNTSLDLSSFHKPGSHGYILLLPGNMTEPKERNSAFRLGFSDNLNKDLFLNKWEISRENRPRKAHVEGRHWVMSNSSESVPKGNNTVTPYIL